MWYTCLDMRKLWILPLSLFNHHSTAHKNFILDRWVIVIMRCLMFLLSHNIWPMLLLPYRNDSIKVELPILNKYKHFINTLKLSRDVMILVKLFVRQQLLWKRNLWRKSLTWESLRMLSMKTCMNFLLNFIHQGSYIFQLRTWPWHFDLHSQIGSSMGLT